MADADRDRDQRELRFRELYQANFRPVQGYAVNRLGAADDVPDVVAEVFTIAWRRLADVPPPPADRLLAVRHRPAGDRAAAPQRRAAAQPARPPRGGAVSHGSSRRPGQAIRSRSRCSRRSAS